jgi:RNA polymerase sigma factor (sigma-70 family)
MRTHELWRHAIRALPDGQTVSDAELLARFRAARDAAAFELVVYRHGPMVWATCRRILQDHHAAEDAFQAAFLALARQAGCIRSSTSVPAWLHRVAVRASLDLMRRGPRTANAAEPDREPIDPRPGPVDRTIAADLTAYIDAAINRLPRRMRHAFVLCQLEGCTLKDAAAELGCPVGTIESRLARARRQLRGLLAKLQPSALAGLFAAIAVPRELRAGTVQAASGTAPVEPMVAALAARATRGIGRGLTIPGVLGATAAALVVVAVGLGQPGAPKPAGTPPGSNEKAESAPVARADRQGDPLPDGAVLRLGTTRLRHANLFSLAFMPDGKLTSFGGDYTVRVWNPATGQLLRERAIEKEAMHRFWGGCLSPEGKRVAMQKIDRMKVFDVESGKELASVKLQSAIEGRARFSPDGQFLAVIDQDAKSLVTRMQLCDVETNTTREFSKVKGYRSEPVFSRNGRRLALAEGPEVVVWEVATGRELLRFKPEGELGGGTVDFDPTGDVLAVLGPINPPQSLQYVQVSTGKPPEGWTAPPVADFQWVRFSPDGASILLGGRKGLQWCDPKTGKVIHSADGGSATPPAFSADGRFVASGGENAIRIWELESGRSADPDQRGDVPREEIHGVTVSPDGKWILTKGGDTGTIHVWDSVGQLKGSIKSKRWGGRYPLFSPDGRHLFGGAPNEIALVRWDFPDGKESARYAFAEPAKDHIGVYHFGLSADGKRLAAITQVSGRGGIPGAGGGAPGDREVAGLTIWDVATGKRLESRDVDVDRRFYGYGAFTPDLRWYFSGDNPLSLTGEPPLRLELPDLSEKWAYPRQAAASPDGRLVAHLFPELVTRGKNRQVEWNRVVINEVASGKQVLILPTGFCGPLTFTPDSREMVVTDPNAITRWDLATRKPLKSHRSHTWVTGSYGNSFASSLTLNRDGTRAVTGHRDSTALVWDLTRPARVAKPLSERELAAAWEDLAGEDAAKAYAAIWSLADAPKEAVPFLRGRLRPMTGPSEEQVKALIAKLDAPGFAAREAAEKELREFGDAIAPALRAALKAKLTGEQKTRVERLLTEVTNPVLGSGDRLRQLRAVTVLEQTATDDARKLLRELAGGLEGTRLTTEAAETLGRLSRRP